MRGKGVTVHRSRAPYPGRVEKTPPRDAGSRTADRLVLAGGVVLILGLLGLGVTLAIAARGGSVPAAGPLLAGLCPLGLAISFAGLVVQARHRSRS